VTEKDEADTRSAEQEQQGNLLDIAELVYRNFPGHQAEIFEGQLTVSPPVDGPHGECLTNLTAALFALHRGRTRILQNVGLWLPTGDDDHVVPDLAVVDADYRDHEAVYKCYAPVVFRLVVEITAGNWRTDVDRKPALYARAGVPVYVIGDRRHGEVVVLTDPRDGEYRTRSVHKPGESFALPESIGAVVELDTDALLLT
jgi:Uma2 family endonuclease